MLIDTHCHLTFDPLGSQVDAVLLRARQAGVRACINIATTIAEARAGLDLLVKFPDTCLVAGIHPHEAAKCGQDDLDALAALYRGQWDTPADLRRVIGIGETGLDFHYDFAPRDRQEELFRFHLRLACEVRRPVVIHARQAEQRAHEIVTEFAPLEGRVVFHCYSADVATARRILDFGGLLSFTGVVTFKNAKTVREAARFAPRDRILLETDAPYLTPEPHRGIFPNEPALLVHTARFLSELRREKFSAFVDATTLNAIRFFGLPEETK